MHVTSRIQLLSIILILRIALYVQRTLSLTCYFISLGTKKMEYKGHQWHEKCFTCSVCRNPIGTKSFIPRDNDIYCTTCYEQKFATRCIKCNQVNNRNFVNKLCCCKTLAMRLLNHVDKPLFLISCFV